MAELLSSLILHIALGLGLAVLVVTTGLGWVALAMRSGPASPRAASFAYPAGLLSATIASALYLVEPVAGLLSLPLLLVPLVVSVRRRRALLAVADRGIAPLVWALPGTVAVALALGLLWHGPTDRVESTAYGDLLYYASKLVSATISITPLRDLLVEGHTIGVVEGAPTYLGGPLAELPGFDPILFQTTSLPVFMLVALVFGLGLAARSDSPQPWRVGPVWAAVLGVLAITSVAYPSWLTESPPVALAVPLAVPVWVLWRERFARGAFAGLAALLGVCFFLTKGFGLIPFAALAAIAFARDHRPQNLRQAAPYLAGAAVLVAAGTVVFVVTAGWAVQLLGVHFLPADAGRGLWEQRSQRDTQAAAPALHAIGQVLLVVALARARAYAVLAALATAMAASWLVVGHGFDIATGMAMLIAALWFLEQPATLVAQRHWVVAAAAFLAVSAWFREISGVRAGFVLVAAFGTATVLGFLGVAGPPGRAARITAAYVLALVAAGTLLALAARPALAIVVAGVLAVLPAAARRLSSDRRSRVAAATTAFLALVGAIGAAAAAQRDDRLALVTARTTLTADDRALWRSVEREVPRDGLVFTSLTGPRIEGDEGWNYYPGIAGRQIYVAGWSNSPLHVREGQLRERLRRNRDVLAGRLAPTRVPDVEGYRSYWAVVRAGERVPRSFLRAYANRKLVLYRISSS